MGSGKSGGGSGSRKTGGAGGGSGGGCGYGDDGGDGGSGVGENDEVDIVVELLEEDQQLTSVAVQQYNRNLSRMEPAFVPYD